MWNRLSSLSFVLFLGVLAGFFFLTIVVNKLGASDKGDAFFQAYGIIMFFVSISFSIQTQLISIFSGTDENRLTTKEKSYLFGILVFVSIVLALVLTLLSNSIISIVVSGSSESIKRMASLNLKQMAPGIVPMVISNVYGANLASKNKFIIYGLQNFIRFFLLTVLIFYLLPILDYKYIGSIFTFSVLIQALIVSSYSIKNELIYPRITRKLPQSLNKQLRFLFNSTSGFTIKSFNSLTLNFICSFLPVGSLVLVELAKRIQGPINSIFLSSITTSFLPTLKEKLSFGNKIDATKILKKEQFLINFTALGIASVIILLNQEINYFLFVWSNFTTSDLEILLPLSLVYLMCIPLRGNFAFYESILYAKEKGSEVYKTSVFYFAIELISLLLLTKYLGIVGIPMSFFFTLFLSSLYILLVLEKEIRIKSIVFSKENVLIYLKVIAFVLISSYIMNSTNLKTNLIKYGKVELASILVFIGLIISILFMVINFSSAKKELNLFSRNAFKIK